MLFAVSAVVPAGFSRYIPGARPAPFRPRPSVWAPQRAARSRHRCRACWVCCPGPRRPNWPAGGLSCCLRSASCGISFCPPPARCPACAIPLSRPPVYPSYGLHHLRSLSLSRPRAGARGRHCRAVLYCPLAFPPSYSSPPCSPCPQSCPPLDAHERSGVGLASPRFVMGRRLALCPPAFERPSGLCSNPPAS